MPPARTRNIKANAGVRLFLSTHFSIIFPNPDDELCFLLQNIVVPGRSAQLASPTSAASAAAPPARVVPKVNPKNIRPPLPVPGSIEYVEGITPPFSTRNLEDDEDDEDDEADDEDSNKGKSSLMFPVADPTTGEEIHWVLSKAAETIVEDMMQDADNRNPDAHDMYVYNDFYGYALIEMMENRIAEWEKAYKRYTAWKAGKVVPKRGLAGASQEWQEGEGWEAFKEMWTQMEGFVLWLNQDDDIYYSMWRFPPEAEEAGYGCAHCLHGVYK